MLKLYKSAVNILLFMLPHVLYTHSLLVWSDLQKKSDFFHQVGWLLLCCNLVCETEPESSARRDAMRLNVISVTLSRQHSSFFARRWQKTAEYRNYIPF